jgi:hypothetical protein
MRRACETYYIYIAPRPPSPVRASPSGLQDVQPLRCSRASCLWRVQATIPNLRPGVWSARFSLLLAVRPSCCSRLTAHPASVASPVWVGREVQCGGLGRGGAGSIARADLTPFLRGRAVCKYIGLLYAAPSHLLSRMYYRTQPSRRPRHRLRPRLQGLCMQVHCCIRTK